MFGFKKKVSLSDSKINYLNHSLLYLNQLLGESVVDGFETQKMSSFSVGYNHSKEDAIQVFKKIKALLNIEEDSVSIDFFWEKPVKQNNDLQILSTNDLFKLETLTLGTYQKKEEHYIVNIEMSVLKKLDLLVYTIVHELSHYILLGQKKLVFNDEQLTDILTLVLGFGAFWISLNTNKQQDTKNGYLTIEEGMYVMAWLQSFKKTAVLHENLTGRMQQIFKQCLSIIEKTDFEKPIALKYAFNIFPDLINFIVKFLINEAIDYGFSEQFHPNTFLYETQLKNGRIGQFKKSRKKLVQTMIDEIEAHRNKNLLELKYVQQAFSSMITYHLGYKQDPFYDNMKALWEENIQERLTDIDQYVEDFNKNRKLAFELLKRKRNEFEEAILPFLFVGIKQLDQSSKAYENACINLEPYIRRKQRDKEMTKELLAYLKEKNL